MWRDNGKITKPSSHMAMDAIFLEMHNGWQQNRFQEGLTETQRLSNLYVATRPDVCQQIGRKRKRFRWAGCYMILLQRCYGVALERQTSFCNKRSDSIIQPLNGNGNNVRGWVRSRGGGGVGGVFSNVWGERASLQQKADARRFTLHRITSWPGYHLHTTWGALYADRSNRTKEGGNENQRWRESRWSD